MARWSVALTLAAVLLPPLQAQDFEYVERWSGVSIHGEITGAQPPGDEYNRWASTTDFNPFDESVADEIEWGGVTVGGDASQISSLAPACVNAEGDVYTYIYDDSGTGDALAWADSLMEVVFDLSEPTPVELSGWLYIPPGQGPPYLLTSHVTLSQLVGGNWSELYAAEGDMPVDFADTLETGRYFLQVECFVGARTDLGEPPIIGSARYEMTMRVVPEPATLLLLALAGLASRRR